MRDMETKRIFSILLSTMLLLSVAFAGGQKYLKRQLNWRLDHDLWAMNKWIDTTDKMNSKKKEATDSLKWCLEYRDKWLKRVLGNKAPKYNPNNLRATAKTQHQAWKKYIRRGKLRKTISYKTTSGKLKKKRTGYILHSSLAFGIYVRGGLRKIALNDGLKRSEIPDTQSSKYFKHRKSS